MVYKRHNPDMRLLMFMACIGVALAWPWDGYSAGDITMNTMPTIRRDDHPWDKSDPLQFLQSLKQDPQKVVEVFGEAPSGWITAQQAEVLLELLGSKEPASPVLELKCPSIPRAPSTEGKQAAYLLLGYVADRYPSSGNSDMQYYSDDKIRRLTSERHRGQPLTPKEIHGHL